MPQQWLILDRETMLEWRLSITGQSPSFGDFVMANGINARATLADQLSYQCKLYAACLAAIA